MSGAAIGTGITAEALRVRLQERLAPTRLAALDESVQHHGHEGQHATRRRTHSPNRIPSPHDAGHSRVACHRLVYDALRDHIDRDRGIHALAIESAPS
ncbi:MAG: BolA family protein [Burkholderiales bacterium]